MNQTFSEYKKTIDDFLTGIDFIYSGDIINSEKLKFSRKLNNRTFSSIFISEIICEIYNWSFKKMFEKSKEIVVHRSKFIDVYELMEQFNLNPRLLFYSKNSNLNLNLGDHLNGDAKNNGYLPGYFIRRFKLMTFGKEVSAYYSPNIEDSSDDCNFYLSDNSNQSMVWSLQNMEYQIIDLNNGLYEHVVNVPVYNCNYNSYKIRVIDTQKIREEKIDILLNGN